MRPTESAPYPEACRKLVLMRHGEAQQEGVSDHARSLTPRGVADAQRIGKKLHAVVGPIRIISSDSTRTTQTCSELLRSLTASQVKFDNNIYTASDDKKLTACILNHAGAADNELMIVGHNPTISQLATQLLGDYVAFSTSECVILKSPETDWAIALQSSGTWQQVKYFSP